MNNNLPSRENLENEYKNDLIAFGRHPVVCAPIINFDSETKGRISQESSGIQLVEIRADHLLSKGLKPEDCMEYLRQQKLPFIFTMRSHLEGGQVEMSSGERLDIIEKSMSMGPACVDLELSTIKGEKTRSDKLIADAQKLKICVIASYHDFEKTPDVERLKEIAREEASTGADMLKIATYVRDENDILTLLRLTSEIRKELGKPMAVMGMGDLGRITRIAAVGFGSDLVFADLFGASASGQIPYNKAREMIRLLYY